jgi:hypothetical protein
MELTTLWLRQWEAGELSEEVLADRVGQLVSSRDGARGFFVVALAGDGPLMDRLPEPIAMQLSSAGAAVVDLTARNLAMSTAMAVHHRRQGDGDQQGRSLRVQRRCQELLQHLESALVTSRLETLLAGTADVGVDREFLERWGYDQEQKQAIAAAIEAVAMA